MDTSECIDKDKRYVVQNYARLPVVFVRGEGMKLWDSEGKEYLDFVAGLGVVGLGHCRPEVTAAATEQMTRLDHVSNLYYVPAQIELAEALARATFADKCFFCNSGAEANEAAIKLARRFGKEGGGRKVTIITALRSFHGRTMKTLAATGQPEKQKPFLPLPPGFKHVPLNDLGALSEAATADVAAIMLEPIQGEGGVYACEPEYLVGVRKLCDKRGILLILDEVQTGMGRTGRLFAHEHFGITPDIMTVAKGLANGLPIGAMLATQEAARCFKPGDHGSTFGGGPVVTAAARATLDVIIGGGVIENSASMGIYFRKKLDTLGEGNAIIKETRGMGLMLAVELGEPVAKDVAARMLAGGVVVNNIGEHILRFLPPLTVAAADIDRVVGALELELREVVG